LQGSYARRKKPRTFKVFLVNLDNTSIFIPRLLTPLQPPLVLSQKGDSWAGDDYAIEKVARFVSLIPYADDSALFEDLPDMTCTA
jgi:coiled-coil and C2 domain-containing protein 2A